MILKVCSIDLSSEVNGALVLPYYLNPKLIYLVQAALIKDPCVSVKRISWGPDGALFGEIEQQQFSLLNHGFIQ